jgi:hypothetical protein
MSGSSNEENDKHNQNGAEPAAQHSNPGKRLSKRHQVLASTAEKSEPRLGLWWGRSAATVVACERAIMRSTESALRKGAPDVAPVNFPIVADDEIARVIVVMTVNPLLAR